MTLSIGRRHSCGWIALVAGAVLPLSAAAQARKPALHDEAIELGSPPRGVRLKVTNGPQGLLLTLGAARAQLPLADATAVQVQVLTIAGGARVAIVRATGAQGEAAALVTRDRRGHEAVLWTGALDARGDPGERHADAIEIADRTGDGIGDVIVGRTREGANLCGEEHTLLAPRAVDPATLMLRPVSLGRLGAPAPSVPSVDASVASPGPTPPPLLASLRATGASSQPEGDATTTLAPVGVTDANPRTYWIAGQGGGARGQFITLRWGAASFPMRALALVLQPLDAPDASRLARPRALSLVGDGGARVRVRIPEAAYATPGQRVWIVPPAPLAWRCLSVVFEEDAASAAATAPAPATPATGFAAIAEVEAYSDLDFGGGLDTLVAEVTGDGPRADDAARLLIDLGARAAAPLAAGWARSSDAGRRRAVRVFAALASRNAEARHALAAALDSERDDLRAAALAALVAGGPDALAELVPRVASANHPGDEAALALAKHAPATAIDPVLAALVAPGGAERPALREALAAAVESAPEGAGDRIAAWSSAEATPVAARAAAALALAHAGDVGATTASALLDATAPSATEFADRWRLVLAAQSLTRTDTADAWLAHLAHDEGRWMLRAGALAALVARASPLAVSSARAALLDPYPRVRMAALVALANDAASRDAIAEHARRDTWPMVRVAALDAIALMPGAEPTLRAGVADRRHIVRAAAVRGIRRAKLRAAWPLVHAHLGSDKEWPDVASEAVAYVRELCVHEGAEDLLAIVQRGVKPNAWEPDVRLAMEALDALDALGGEAAAQARAIATGPLAPAGFRVNAERSKKQPPVCVPR